MTASKRRPVEAAGKILGDLPLGEIDVVEPDQIGAVRLALPQRPRDPREQAKRAAGALEVRDRRQPLVEHAHERRDGMGTTPRAPRPSAGRASGRAGRSRARPPRPPSARTSRPPSEPLRCRPARTGDATGSSGRSASSEGRSTCSRRAMSGTRLGHRVEHRLGGVAEGVGHLGRGDDEAGARVCVDGLHQRHEERDRLAGKRRRPDRRHRSPSRGSGRARR